MSEPTSKRDQRSRQVREQSKRVDASLDKLQTLSATQNKRLRELERKDLEFQQIYLELANRTSAVCHDILITRPRGDAWALAFAYLSNAIMANFGMARQCGDKSIFDAMLTNLNRLADAMAKSFPDRKLVIDPWNRAIRAFGEINAPSYDSKPHPHVDSWSQILLTLRDTGPSLTDFREFFAPSEAGLHIIRPA
jgi:hypothetical protein